MTANPGIHDVLHVCACACVCVCARAREKGVTFIASHTRVEQRDSCRAPAVFDPVRRGRDAGGGQQERRRGDLGPMDLAQASW